MSRAAARTSSLSFTMAEGYRVSSLQRWCTLGTLCTSKTVQAYAVERSIKDKISWGVNRTFSLLQMTLSIQVDDPEQVVGLNSQSISGL